MKNVGLVYHTLSYVYHIFLPYVYHINISIIIYMYHILLGFHGEKAEKNHSVPATACSATASSVTAVAGTSGNGD